MRVLYVDVPHLQRLQALDRVGARQLAHRVAGHPEFKGPLVVGDRRGIGKICPGERGRYAAQQLPAAGVDVHASYLISAPESVAPTVECTVSLPPVEP